MKRLLTIALIAALNVIGGCSSEPKTESELREAGKKAFVQQDFATARDYLGRLVHKHPSDREILYFLGMSYSKDLKYDSALYYLERVDRLYPDDRETNLELYKIGMMAQDAQVAKDAIAILIKTGDPTEMYYEDLAHLSLLLEQYALATRYFRLLLDNEPDNPQRYIDAANAVAGLDSLDAAVALLDSAIERFGPKKEFLLNKSLYLTAQDKYEKSVAILRELIAQDTSNLGYQVNLAHALASMEGEAEHREAYALYQKLKDRVDRRFAIDSLMQDLEQKLNNVSSE